MKSKKIKAAVLLGGTSPEREVSQSSGKSVYEALKNSDYEIKLIDPAYGKDQPSEAESFFSKTKFSEISNDNYLSAINSGIFDDIDVAFIALHGKWGEDGTIQSLLELKNIPYTGSGVLSSSLSMDKSMSKIMFQHYEVKTPKWFVIKKDLVEYKTIKSEIKKLFSYPCIIKPNDQGSTIGLSICRGDSEVEDAIDEAFKFSDTVLVEEYIKGREMAVGILEQHALPIVEIKPKHLIYDYECKYTDGMSEYFVPAEIPENIAHHLHHKALQAFNSLGCKDFGRVDFILDKDYNSYCLEVNTLPGLTSHSLFPKGAKAEGIGFPELMDRIIKNTLNEKKRIKK